MLQERGQYVKSIGYMALTVQTRYHINTKKLRQRSVKTCTGKEKDHDSLLKEKFKKTAEKTFPSTQTNLFGIFASECSDMKDLGDDIKTGRRWVILKRRLQFIITENKSSFLSTDLVIELDKKTGNAFLQKISSI